MRGFDSRLPPSLYKYYGGIKWDKTTRVEVRNVLIVFTSALILRSNGIEENLLDGFPSRFFMGFGYNQDLIKTGERLDILDYFSWVKVLSEIKDVEWFLWDASCYYIVNRIKQKKISEDVVERKETSSIMNTLFEEIETKKPEIRGNNRVRKQYLNAILTAFSINGTVIDAYDIIREDVDYLEAFYFCLDFCKRQQNIEPEKIPIPRNSNNRVELLYFPLETAEALFLKKRFDINTKFGPQTEKNFDYFITKAVNEKGGSYRTLWCPNPPIGIKIPYLKGDENSIFFTDDMNGVRRKLDTNESYRMWLEQIIEPLSPGLDLEQSIDKVITEVRGKLK